MKTCLRPYEGTQPYIFVSYAHKNDAAVLEIIGTLQSRGFRVWYDEGIEAGSEWPESIASHLERAQLVLAFLSPAYLCSDNCRKEMHYALTKKKPVINVYLEQTELSPGMEMQIGNLFALMKYTYPSEEYFYDKLFSAELLDADKFAGEAPELPPEAPAEPPQAKKGKEKKSRAETPRRERPAKAPKPERAKKKRGIAAAIIAVVLAGCLIAAGIVGHFTGLTYRFTARTVTVQTLPDDTVAVFQSPLLEQAARDYAGKPEGELTVADLKGLTALYVCGDRFWFSAPQQGVDTAAAGVETAEVIDPSGQSVTVQRGAIRDLSDLAYFPSLRELALEFQSLTTLESLPACGVEVFDIRANRLTSLAGIEQLPKLTALLADGNAVTELTGLGRCLNVRTLHLNGANVSDLSELRALTKLQDITLVLLVVLSFVLVWQFGLGGVVAATVAAHCLMWFGRVRVVFGEYLPGLLGVYVRKQLLRTAVLAGEMLAAAALCSQINARFTAFGGLAALVLDGCVAMVLPNAVNAVLFLPTSDAVWLREKAAGMLGAVRARFQKGE